MVAKAKKNKSKAGVTLQMTAAGLALLRRSAQTDFHFYPREVGQGDADVLQAIRKLCGRRPLQFILSPADYQLQLCEKPDVDEKELNSELADTLAERLDLDRDDVVCQTFAHPKVHGRSQRQQLFVVLCSRKRLLRQRSVLDDAGLRLQRISIPELIMVPTLLQVIDDDVFAFLYWQGRTGVLLVVDSGYLVAKRVVPGLEEIEVLAKQSELCDQFVLAMSRQLHELLPNESCTLYVNPTAKDQKNLLSMCKRQLDYDVKAFAWPEEGGIDNIADFYRYGLAVWGEEGCIGK